MELFLFNKPKYEQLYNCSLYSVDQIPIEQRRQVVLGSIWLGLTTIFQFLYVPCMFSIRKHVKNPCYALMFYIGIIDMLTLIMNGWFSGYFGLVGMMFCQSPKLNYFLGLYGLGFWIMETTAECILAFNRCLELWSSHVAEQFFGGRKIYLWIAFPTLYGASVSFFSRSFSFNSIHWSWFSYPHADYITNITDISEYINIPHAIHNNVVLVTLVGTYAIFCIMLLCKQRGARGSSNSGTNISQKMIFFQVLTISTMNAIAAGVYVYMQNFSLSNFVIFLGSFAWLCAHGLPPIIYLVMNRTIRNDCIRMFGCSNNVVPGSSFGGLPNSNSKSKQQQKMKLASNDGNAVNGQGMGTNLAA